MNEPRRTGLTIIELLVVISIVTLLVSISLPAVQAAREAARQVSCRNNLRQCGLALGNFESSHRQFPSNGWGWAWVGDASIGNSLDGPGGWIWSILPQLEETSLWEQTRSPEGRLQAIATSIPVLICPSRRGADAFPYTQTAVPLRNSAMPEVGSRTDYAINAGDQIVSSLPGPDSIEDLPNFPRPSPEQYSGISYVRSSIRARDVRDGMSNTLAVAEKLIPTAAYLSGQSLGDDQTALLGDDADIRRWTQFLPLRDGDVDDIERFGSAHATGVNGVMCDGSVRVFGFGIDGHVWRSVGNRRGSHDVVRAAHLAFPLANH